MEIQLPGPIPRSSLAAYTQRRSVLERPAEKKSATVLVVDDSRLNRRVLSDLLREAGHHVVATESAVDALRLLGERRFDLLLLDLVLPEMDGLVLLARVKQSPDTRDLPVIMITGTEDMQSAAQCIQQGAEDYLLKPFDPILLRARIDACIEKSRLRSLEQAYHDRVARDNDRKTGEIERARQIQSMLLPSESPACNFLEIDAAQWTASEVGGDYYDFFHRPDGALVAAIGDATGHGVGAGSMVAMTKALLLAWFDYKNLAGLCGRLNRIMVETGLKEESNMALNLLAIRPEDSGVRVRVSGGSMPPVYVLRADGRLDQFQLCGPPLGLIDFDDITYDETQFSALPGDNIILMSDGLPEIMSPDKRMLDYDRLEERLTMLDPSRPCSMLLSDILRIGDDWAEGEPLKDDLTAVVLKVRET